MALKSSPILAKIMSFHEYQGVTNDCGPYCLAMLVSSLGKTRRFGRDIAQELNTIRWRFLFPSIKRIKNWATFPWAVAGYLQSTNIPMEWRILCKAEDLVSNLEKPCPPIVIIGGWRPIWAHYMILVQHDSHKGFGFADPATPSPGVHWIPKAHFLKQWQAMGRMAIMYRK